MGACDKRSVPLDERQSFRPEAQTPPPTIWSMEGLFNQSRRSSGFTLIELMIAVAIVAILAAVALPVYNDAIRKSRRTDAFTALSSVQQAQERWRANNASYSDQLTATATATPPGLGQAANSPNGHYAIALSGVGTTGYTVTATPNTDSSQRNDGDCSRLQVRVAVGNVFYGSASLTGNFNEGASNRCWSR